MRHPRYFVTYRHWTGGTNKTTTTFLGRFINDEAADAEARSRFAYGRGEVLKVAPETYLQMRSYQVVRFCIRSARIFAALFVVLIALWIADSNGSVGSTPLSSLTLNMLLGAALKAAIALGLLFAAWHIAFGRGPEG